MASVLEIVLGIKSGAVNAGLDKVESQLSSWSGRIAKVVTGGFATFEIGKLISGALEKAVEIGPLSRKFGIGVEELQRLTAAAKRYGLDMEMVAKGGFKAFAEAQKAVAGDASARKHFENLGISLQQLAGLRGPADTIMALADAVHGATNQHAALAAASEIVGTRQAGLIQLFRLGADEIRRIGNEMVVMDGKSQKALETANKQLTRLKNTATNITGNLVGIVMDGFDRMGAAAGTMIRAFMVGPKQALKEWTAERDEWKRMQSEDKNPGAPTGDIAEDDARETTSKLESLESRLADLRESHRLQELSLQERIVELTKKELDLQKELYSMSDTESILQKQIELENTRHERIESQKQADQEAKRNAEQIKKTEEEHAEKVLDSSFDLAKEKDKDALDAMSKEERIAALKQRARLSEKAADGMEANGADALDVIEQRKQALQFAREAKKLEEGGGGAKAMPEGDALRRIGGNLAAAIGGEGKDGEAKKQTSLQQQLVEETKKMREAFAKFKIEPAKFGSS